MQMNNKIPFYNVVNMFFVGAVFSLFLAIMFYNYIPFEWIKANSELLSDWSVLISAILLIAMYELGFIINRMGSIIVAPAYKKIRIWPAEHYGIDVSELAQSNSRFQSMITELSLMRSHIMMFFLLLVFSLIRGKWIWCVCFVALIFVFTFGGRKHNEKINISRKQFSERKENGKQETQKIKEYLEDN